MPLRSVIDIDVNDQTFREFEALFQKYQAAVARLPGQWAQVNRTQAQQRNIFVDIASAMMAQAEMLRRNTQEAEKFDRTIVRSSRSMQTLARATREFSGNLMSATTTMLKWTGVTGVVGSLVGLLSGEGIAHLAAGASQTYRSTMGYAGQTTPGQVGAAGAYGSILDPRQALGQLTEMLTTAEGKRGLVALGIGPGMWGRGAGALLPEFLRRLQRLSQSVPEQNLGDVLGGMGLGGFGEQARILRRMTPGQLEELNEIRAKNERELNSLTTDMLLKWVKLNAQLDLAGTKIHNAFVEGLTRVAPVIERFVEVGSNKIAEFVKSPAVGKWIEDLASSLENIDIEKFAEGIKKGGESALDFVHDMKDAIGGIQALIKWIKDLPSKIPGHEGFDPKIDNPTESGWTQLKRWWNTQTPAATAPIPPAGPPQSAGTRAGNWIRESLGIPGGGGGGRGLPGGAAEGNIRAPLAGRIIDKARALGASDAAIAAMLSAAMGEGGLGQSWKAGDHGSSFGHWQLHWGGELNRYLKEGNKPGDTDAQVSYVLKRLNEIYPGFSQIKDPTMASRVLHRFEKSVQGPGYYAAGLGAAAKLIREHTIQPNMEAGRLDPFKAAGVPAQPTRDPYAAVRGAPGVKFNSRGQPYSAELETMPDQQKRNVEASMAAIRAAMRAGKTSDQFYGPVGPPINIDVSKPANVRVRVENQAGANPVTGGAQVQ